MSRVICAHCQASWEVDVAEMAPRETAVRCLRCGKDTTVDGLALLQEGASELELEWGDRVPRAPQADAPLVAAATALVARGDDPGHADLPEPSSREGQVGLEDVAAVTATLLLGLGIAIETWAAVEALFDASIDVAAYYLPDAARVALSMAAAVSFAAWSQLVLASRRANRGAVDDPFFTLLLAPFRPARAQAAFSRLTELSGGPAALARQGESTFPWVLLVGFWGWLAWSLYVLWFRPHTGRSGFMLECLLCLLGAAAYSMALGVVRARQRVVREASSNSRDERPREDTAAVAAPTMATAARSAKRACACAAPAVGAQPGVAGPAAEVVAGAVASLLVPAATACPSCGEVAESPRCARCGAARRVYGARMLRALSRKPHACTYLAQTANGVRFVLKEMAFALAPDVAAIAAFERETELLRQLSHPKIPRFCASFREGQGAKARFYLAQELVEGSSLESELANHRYSEAEVIDVLEQMLRVLVYLHGLSPPILHRDLKPANIIRRRDGALFLVDFGAAREGGRTLSSATLVGTFGYMPPEQLAGQVDQTSDLFALGMTALHLLVQRPPWELFADDPDSFPKGVNVSARLRRFLERLTARRRSKRTPTARRALAELAKVVEGRAEAPRWLVPAIATVAALLALAGLAVAGSRVWADSPQPVPRRVTLTPPAALAPPRQVEGPTSLRPAASAPPRLRKMLAELEEPPPKAQSK